MVYAPICIKTLNRYQHLKNCIESLAANDLAKETELYIALDYPPSEKYVEGYEKVKAYLDSGIKGFKNVNIIKRDVNYGSYRNSIELGKMVFEKYDSYITTEDDNIFSKNFLVYMNQALEMYKDDSHVVAVTAYSHQCLEQIAQDVETYGYNAFFETNCSGWGLGFWREKEKKVQRDCDLSFLKRIISDRDQTAFFREKLPWLYIEMIETYIKKHRAMYYPGTDKIGPIDTYRILWNIVNDAVYIVPTVSKSKNYGIDGSGEHGAVNETGCDSVLLDDAKDFDLKVFPDVDMNEIYRAYISGRYYNDDMMKKADFWVGFCRLFGRRPAVVIVEIQKLKHTIFRLSKKAVYKIINKILFAHKEGV